MTYRNIVLNDFAALIRSGKVYLFTTLTATYTATTPVDVHVTTAASVHTHINLAAASGGDAVLSLFEAPSVATPTYTGTLGRAENRNRRVTTATCQTQFRTNPTVSSTGTPVYAKLIPGGTGTGSQGQVGQAYAEIILAPSQTYLLRLQNLTTTQPGEITCHLYEDQGET